MLGVTCRLSVYLSTYLSIGLLSPSIFISFNPSFSKERSAMFSDSEFRAPVTSSVEGILTIMQVSLFITSNGIYRLVEPQDRSPPDAHGRGAGTLRLLRPPGAKDKPWKEHESEGRVSAGTRDHRRGIQLPSTCTCRAISSV